MDKPAQKSPHARPGTCDARALAARLAALDNAHQPVLVDVREQQEWQEGHLPGALHVPLGQLEADARGLVDRLDGREAVIYCRAGVRSLRAIGALEAAGAVGRLVNLTGGILAWQAAGERLVRDA